MEAHPRSMDGMPSPGDPRNEGAPASQEYKQWATAMQAYYRNQPNAAHASPYYAAQLSPAYANLWGGQAQMMAPYTASPFYPASVYPGAQPPYAAYSVPGPAGATPLGGPEGAYARSAAKDPAEAVNAERQAGLGGASMGGEVHGGGGPSSGPSSEAAQIPPTDMMRGPDPSAPSSSTITNAQEYWRRQHASHLVAPPAAPGVEFNNATASLIDEREAKRQRRKQSNRESARRSRLRKQSECEDLANRVNSLTMENKQLRIDCGKALEMYNSLCSNNLAARDKVKVEGGNVPPQPVVPPPHIDLVRVLASAAHQPVVASAPEEDDDDEEDEEKKEN
ncbi:G-box binding protein MFMR [Cymbomonas tetramitiformis]|uniref:G-box binding protein MFMR n=1 Tax=Cymbomonas tetramitiformis TaxID=36881 RepID=A0AAE0C8L5_9CHLO|nr:G-box binding protein MFMR [Cymbomonas tetramitiformis]